MGNHLFQVIFIISLFLNISLVNSVLVYKYQNADEEGKILENKVLQVDILPSKASDAIQGDLTCTIKGNEIAEVQSVKKSSPNFAVVKVKTFRLGRAYMTCIDESSNPQSVEVQIVVIRPQNFVDTIFPIYIFLMIVSLNTLFGTEVSVSNLRFILSNPKPLVTAAICQFVFLPPVGLGIARAMGYEPDVTMGIVMVACAPGGGISNTAAYLVEGEISLSIAMTFFSTAIAIGEIRDPERPPIVNQRLVGKFLKKTSMMPLNIWIYARFVSDDPKFSPESIPYLRLVFTLVLIAIPVIIGMLLISKAPKWTKKVVRFAKPAALVFMLTFIALAIYRSRYVFSLMSVKSVFGACLLPVSGFVLGAIGSAVMRLRLSQLKTIAIEVAMQNSGLVIGMTQVAFEQPEADLNAIMPIYIALMTSAVSIPMVMAHFVILKFSPKYKEICKENREALEQEKSVFDAKNEV